MGIGQALGPKPKQTSGKALRIRSVACDRPEEVRCQEVQQGCCQGQEPGMRGRRDGKKSKKGRVPGHGAMQQKDEMLSRMGKGEMAGMPAKPKRFKKRSRGK